MPEMIIAAIPYFGIGLGSSMIVILRTCSIKIAQWKFQAVYWGKVLFVNILLQTVAKYYYEGIPFYDFLEAVASLVWLAILPHWLQRACSDDVTKAICMVWLGDGAALVGTAASGLFSNLFVFGSGVRVVNALGVHTAAAMVFGLFWMILLSRGGKKIFGRLRRLEIKHKGLVWTLFLIYFLLAWFMAGKLSLQEGTTLLQSYIMTGIVGIILVVGSLFYLKEEQRRLYKENQNLLLQRRLMEAYDSSLREQIELTRKMRHDIANHIQTLEELMHVVIPADKGAEQIADYAQKLRCQFQELQGVVYCSKPLINAVITSKVKRCMQEGIRTDIRIHSFEYGRIPDCEIISVLFNLFDNAIEGCERLSEERERFLELVCDNNASWLMIRIKNSSEAVKIEEGRPQTVKKGDHGLGLSIIEDVVKRHNGTWEYQAQGDIFEVNIALETGT